MPQSDVAKPRATAGRRRHGAHDYRQLLANWPIEDIAKLRYFRANRTPGADDIPAFAASIGRSPERVRALLWALPEKPCFASDAVIDDGPLTFAERMALIWDQERKR